LTTPPHPSFTANELEVCRTKLGFVKPFNFEVDEGFEVEGVYEKGRVCLTYEYLEEEFLDLIRIEIQPRHLGGYQHYFVCAGCDKPRYLLREGRYGFICGRCYGLPYYSQMCTDHDGAVQRRDKLRWKLENESMRNWRWHKLYHKCLEEHRKAQATQKFPLYLLKAIEGISRV
jgi:hypothetical protein